MDKITKTGLKLLLDILEITFISISIAALTFLFLAQPLEVTGDSMIPNYENKEQLIVEKISIKFKELSRGEVVIIKHPKNPKVFLIKRVVGLPNDTFTINEGNVYINGTKLEEHYLFNDSPTYERKLIKDGEPIQLASNEYIVLGDNRENSSDSRVWGPINTDSIVGRSLVVYYPLRNIRLAQ